MAAGMMGMLLAGAVLAQGGGTAEAPVAAAQLAASQIQAVAAFEPLPNGVPQPPANVSAAKAYAVLQSACARCHQAQRSDLPAPAGNFGNVLDLEALAREPGLVVPGMPDASRLYTLMLDRHLPLDVLSGANAEDLTSLDVEAVRDWIEHLPRDNRSCPGRQPIDAAELDGLMSGWLGQVGTAARSTRFISLAHLYNSCATDQELTAWREAVSKLLASLSWAPLPARVETIGDKLALLAVRIGDLGWVPAHWDRLASREPAGGAPFASQAVKAASGTPHPVVRADWLASAASRPPLSHELLGLPKQIAEVGRLLGADTKHDHSAPWVSRIVVESSAETGRPRVIERQQIASGGLWMAHDLPAGTPLADLQAQPGKPGVTALSRRLMFNLPNGMLAFAVFDAEGALSDLGAPAAGATCYSCHTAGLMPPLPDMMKAAGGGDKAGQGLVKPLDDDKFRYRRALVQANVDPDRMIGGLEIITSLGRRYEMPVDLLRVASENAMPVEELTQRLLAVAGEARAAARRLVQGTLSRAELEGLLTALAGAGTTAAAGGSRPHTGGGIELALWSDEPRHRAGDLVSFNVKASAACNLTLISVDAAGRATVLFPSELEPDNAIPANTIVRIPRDNAPYQLRMSKPGTETAVALCHPSTKLPAGVAPDYERQRFTVLGNWRNFLRGEARAADEDPRSDRARGSRKRGRNGKPEAKADPAAAMPEQPTARAAIAVVVDEPQKGSTP